MQNEKIEEAFAKLQKQLEQKAKALSLKSFVPKDFGLDSAKANSSIDDYGVKIRESARVSSASMSLPFDF